MGKFDFLTKTLVDSFSYTTTTQNRESCASVNIEGRRYVKFGVLQAVTIVGNLYEDHNGNRILTCGISKQHPCDTKCDKEKGYEIAALNAMSNPDIIFNTVPKYLDKDVFYNMMDLYVNSMDLEFIKTTKELEAAGLDPKKYNR